MLDKYTLKVKISDIGDLSLWKHARIFWSYDYKSVYSSPEVLEGALDKLDPMEEFDVYSFGMIMWFIFTETIPFNNSVNTAYEFVVKENSRPKLPDYLT